MFVCECVLLSASVILHSYPYCAVYFVVLYTSTVGDYGWDSRMFVLSGYFRGEGTMIMCKFKTGLAGFDVSH